MALGSNTGTAKTYLSVGFGKIRQKQTENKQKVDANTPNAVKRETQSGAESWALEHDFVSGKIEKIFFKEDKEYGNSFEVVISDAVDIYQLSFTEESRFWFDFAKKLPNIDLSKEVKITAYDFEDKESKKRRAGISIEQSGVKINSFYDEKDGDKYKLLHGFPNAPTDMNWKDKDEVKVYFISVKKFLRSEFTRLFAEKWNETGRTPMEERDALESIITPNKNGGASLPEDDLPF
jgi:hypothetical protein